MPHAIRVERKLIRKNRQINFLYDARANIRADINFYFYAGKSRRIQIGNLNNRPSGCVCRNKRILIDTRSAIIQTNLFHAKDLAGAGNYLRF